jgi:hypothetical protein
MHQPPSSDLESIRILVNNRPEADFCGLTPNEMFGLIYSTYSEQSPIKINPEIPNVILDSLPFFRLTEEFLRIIQRDKQIKLTPLGALPKKTMVELYNHRLILEEGVEHGIHKLTREQDSMAITALHFNTVFAGLIRKSAGKLVLTKEGTRLLLPEHRNQLFRKVFESYTDKLPWSSIDGYPEIPIGNMGWGFTMLLLLKFGDISREDNFYADFYFKAFPDFTQTYTPLQYSTPAQQMIRCYCFRTFDHFLEWWGLVKVMDKKIGADREQIRVVRTEAVKEIFGLEE